MLFREIMCQCILENIAESDFCLTMRLSKYLHVKITSLKQMTLVHSKKDTETISSYSVIINLLIHCFNLFLFSCLEHFKGIHSVAS